MGTFEVVDKRGVNKVVEEKPAAVAALEVERPGVFGEKLEWKSKGYTLVMMPINGQTMLAGRAVGMRTDERVFIADWYLPPVWSEELSWQAEALKRLETFKTCSCNQRGRCKYHGEKCPGQVSPGQWFLDDMERIRKVQNEPLPECIEVLMKAEMARSKSQVVPVR